MPVLSPKSEHLNSLLQLLGKSKGNINRPVQILTGQPNQTPHGITFLPSPFQRIHTILLKTHTTTDLWSTS